MEFGRDATSQALSDEDIIKNLNTRLLAGETPDVLFLDGLPIRSLMEKGVLASLDGVVSMDGYYENILTAYSLDGRPYAYPSVFRVPVFVSGSSEINVDDYASLASLAALYQEQSLIFNTSYEDIFDSFYIASSAGLFPEEKRIDEDALRAFLQSTREMIDGQQITAQTNEYVMASGNGQSVAQSEFAMSLIKVAEGSYPCGTGVVSSRSDALKLFWSYPAVAIRPLPGSGFEAKEIVSIPANAANPTLAKAFVQIMLTDPVVQLNSLYKGFSVQRDVENAYLAHVNDASFEHMVQPKLVYISLPTENGGLYSKAELTALHDVCTRCGLYLFIDGARLGYGLTAPENDVTLADLCALSDVFYIGGTKVGALFGEAVVITNPALKTDFRYHIKQRGGMLAKGRLLGIQFDELFTDDLYFKISEKAVRQAKRIAKACEDAGCAFFAPSPTNQQFPIFPDTALEKLAEKYKYSYWARVDETHSAVRLCTSWATTDENVDALCKDIASVMAE